MTFVRGNSAAPTVRGYTLVELLTVIALVSVLAGLSVSAFLALPGRLAHETAASSLRALLRRARASAIETRADAAVIFEKGRIEARAWATVAHLRFEDVPEDPTASAAAPAPPPL